MTDERITCSECGHEFDWDSDREDDNKDLCDQCHYTNVKDAEYEFWESYR